MPSSTSNSEPKALRYIIGLLAALLIGQVALQAGANWVMRHYGKNEMRWAGERKAATGLVHDGKGVMLIGSSVLLGVNEDQLRAEMPDWNVRRMVMVGAAYADWYYSIKRLSEEGVKPDYIVIPALRYQLISDAFRGDYLPLHWISRQDIPELAREKGMGLTSISNLYVSSFNSFFALRDDVRNAFLGVLIPGHKVLVAGLPNKRIYKAGEVDQLTADRLSSLEGLTSSIGARLILLHYPAPGLDEEWKTVEKVAHSKNIPFVTAVEHMPETQYADGLHLNPEGIRIYTQALGPALTQELNKLRSK